MSKPISSKIMTASEAVKKFVSAGDVVGLGGQNVVRRSMVMVHEIIRQGKRNLTLTGCNLSIDMDLLVGAGLVKKCESGTGNLGYRLVPTITYAFRRLIEQGKMEMEDWSHIGIVSRFLAGEMGLPFMPVTSLLGSDILNYKAPSTKLKSITIDNPFNPEEKVVLVPALNPDVSIIHAQKVDELGNIIIEGFTTHEPEMIRASKAVIVSCEEIVSSEETRRYPERTTIPHIYVSAIVEQPWGAHPTSTYRYYDTDVAHLKIYQDCAIAALKEVGGIAKYEKYLEDYVLSCNSFNDYLEKIGGIKKMIELQQEMLKII